MSCSLKEFLHAAEIHERNAARLLFWSVGGLFGCLFLALITSEVVKFFTTSPLPKFIAAGGFALGLPLLFFLLSRMEKEYRKFPQLTCSHCGKSLASGKRIVIASRNCFHCGQTVIEPSENPPCDQSIASD